MSFIVFLGIGALAGFMAGLFGIGGGVIIVPLLALTFEALGFPSSVIVHMATGTSLATIAITSLSSASAHFKRESVRFDCLKLLLPGLVFGAMLGVVIGGQLSGAIMSMLLSIFFLLVAAKLLFSPSIARGQEALPSRPGMLGAGGVIGALSALFGVGGGTLSVPFLEWRGVPMRSAVGTSSACGVPIAIIGALTAIVVGWSHAGLPPWATGYVYWPAFIGIVLMSTWTARFGARAAHFLPERWLKRAFAALLIVMALKFLIS
ncbi:sulfite exporter TauE/SafE family protein [Larsenimonas salina]|uniref:sulfite exporter TauE/SafE family protein n=1 Tax=Larsenimonas salina TaxID=1295565 RepID=UPI00207446FF|nr:sulfite exporter TauE/SafE family protein [Larsenimonas salina]MCM5704882.1 sulfite exporter TauE/SafE family protein [Larsenimonas salina]